MVTQNILSQDAYDLHDKLVKVLETCQTLEVLEATAKQHYNEIYVAQKLNHALPLSQRHLEAKRLDELETLRFQVDRIVTERQPELIQDWCDRVSADGAEQQKALVDKVGDMLPLLEEVYERVKDFVEFQHDVIEAGKKLEIYRNRGYKTGAVQKEYRLPWSPILGLGNGSDTEKFGVVLKAIVSQYLNTKSPTSPIDPGEMMKSQNMYFVQPGTKRSVGSG